jgi:hypothetical protein
MSELIKKTDHRGAIRWKLLAGVSALALTTYISSSGFARAEDADRPILWIELGGRLSELQDGQEAFAPPLMDGRPSIFEPSQKFEKPPKSSIDEYGALSFQPQDSDWVFSASVQFGRSKSSKHHIQQTNPLPTAEYIGGNRYIVYPGAQQFAETKTSSSEQHAILDFQVGKDVGFGLFKSGGISSLIGFGVRFAQFKSTSNFSLKSDPDWHFTPKYFSLPPYIPRQKLMDQAFHSNLASMTAERSFHGIGPSVSWKSSMPLTGTVQDGEIEADWGINGAILFGRQKAQTHHQSTARYKPATKYAPAVPKTISHFPATPDHTRSRGVVVPNIGGFAGLSFQYSAAKISAGYRADLFFSAMDGGIDAAKKENVGFYGPFASVSIGLGG